MGVDEHLHSLIGVSAHKEGAAVTQAEVRDLCFLHDTGNLDGFSMDFPHFDRHRYSLIKLNGGSYGKGTIC
jgi:hypothetical protein